MSGRSFRPGSEDETFETPSAAGQRAFDELKLAEELPSIPGLCLVVLGLTHEDHESNEALIECIRLDPALTGRAIQAANAARPAGTPPVTTARAAAALLDATALRGIALGFCVLGHESTQACRAFDHRRYWRRALACAASAEALARRFHCGDPEEAFTLGLLAEVGLLAMATVHPAEFEKVLQECDGKNATELVLAEMRALRVHHWQVAADLCAEWGMSEAFRAPFLAFSAGPPDDDGDLAQTARSTWLLMLALDMAQDIVGTPGTPAASRDSGAPGRRRSDRESETKRRLEVSAVTDEARKRWQQLVDQCGLDAKPPAAGDTEPITTSRPIQDATAAPAVPSGKETRRILVVDDDPGARHLISLHLRRAGYDVISAPNGEAGLRAAVSECPLIVITDWLMPGISGVDLCKALRRSEAGRKIYILLLTSREEEDSIVQGLEAGANDYLTKPFNPRVLLARVNAGNRVMELQRQIENDKLVDKKRTAQMAQMMRQHRSLARMDVLTQLPNRRYAMDQLEEAWNAAVRQDRPLSVVMIDIDHFKRVNDQHGHQAGDEVLRNTANLLRSKCRRSETVCRLGGEEFLLICVNAGLEAGLKCAERLRAAVEANKITTSGFDGNVTVSLGVAERTPQMQKLDDLVRAADDAVYAAKELGRNQVCGGDRPGGLSKCA